MRFRGRSSGHAATILLSCLTLTGCTNPWSLSRPPESAVNPFALNQGQAELERSLRGGEIDFVWGGAPGILYYSERNALEPAIWRLDAATGQRERVEVSAGPGIPASVAGDGCASEITLRGVGVSARPQSKVELTVCTLPAVLDLDTAVLTAHATTLDKPQTYGDRFPQTPGGALVEVASPDNRRFISADGERLLVREAGRPQARPLFSAPQHHIWNHYSLSWAPGSDTFAAIVEDFSEAPREPIVAWTSDDRRIDEVYHPVVGGPFPQGRIAIVDVGPNSDLRYLYTGSSDHYLRIDRFSDDGRALHYFRVARDALALSYWRHDLVTNERSLLFRDESDTPLTYPYAFALAPDGAPLFHLRGSADFLWVTERNARSELLLYRHDGYRYREIDLDLEQVARIIGVDGIAEKAFVLARTDPERPYDTHLVSIALAGGDTQILSSGPGFRSVWLSPDKRYAIESVSSPSRPTRTYLRNLHSGGAQLLSEARFEKPDRWTSPEEITALAADGVTPLYGLLYRPAGFDPEQRYPLVEYIYAGPQTTWTPTRFLQQDRYARVLAAAGFAVVVVDGRGTPYREPAFRHYSYLKLGQVEIEDHAAVIRSLLSRYSFLDGERVGVFGTSFGAYFAIRALADAPDVYRAGVASAPPLLTKAHIFSPVEVFAGVPERNPATYEAMDILRAIERVEAPVLLLAGSSDANTPLSHTMTYADAFIERAKPVEMVLFPGRNHHFKRRGEPARDPYWIASIVRFFTEHLCDSDRCPKLR